jgi:hypothetical protein
MPATIAFTGTRAIRQCDLIRLVELVEALPARLHQRGDSDM